MVQVVISDIFEDVMVRNFYFRRYIEQFRKKYGKMLEFYVQFSRDMKDILYFNIFYFVGDLIFVYIYMDFVIVEKCYIVIELRIESVEEEEKYKFIKDKILEFVLIRDIFEDQEEFERFFDVFFDEVVFSLVKGRRVKFIIIKDEMEKFCYFIKCDIIGIGLLELIVRDLYIEDIYIIGVYNVFFVYKIFEMMQINIDFGDDVKLVDYFKNMVECIGRFVSDRMFIVDGVLLDGFCINIIYLFDILIKGLSVIICKFLVILISIVQFIGWGMFSVEVVVYLWIVFEYGMSVFVCGEMVFGKIIFFNVIILFIKFGLKIYIVEDIFEVQVFYLVWQRFIICERGFEESRVMFFDFLKVVLCLRLNYIIVGEICGVEGVIVF